jgi:hypothetical protein
MGLNDVSANVARDFRIAERLNFEATFQVYNLFNHDELGGMTSTSPTSSQFGQVSSDGSPNTVPRFVEIQGRFQF